MLRLLPAASTMLAVFTVFVGATQMHAATISIFGDNTVVAIGGTGGLNGSVTGYNSTVDPIPNNFNSSILVQAASGTSTASSSSLNFSSAPYTYIGGTLYFVFVLDIQESGGTNRPISIDVIDLIVAGVSRWSTTDAILVNSGTPLTLTPTNNGADMAFFAPVAAFNGLGLTGSSTFILRVTQSLASGGSEEWLFTSTASSGVGFFRPDELISDPRIPEPSTFALALLGGSLVALRAFRKSRR